MENGTTFDGDPLMDGQALAPEIVPDSAGSAPVCEGAVRDTPPIPQRGTDGRWLPGNEGAVTHGRYRSLDRPELRSLIDQERAAVLDALGGVDNISPQMVRVVDSFAEHAVLRDAALTRVLDEGLLTSKGRQRAILRVFQSLDEAMVRRAQLIGLERRQKDVRAMSAQQWVEQQQQDGRP